MERTTGAPDTARFFIVQPAGANNAALLARLRTASLVEQGYLADAHADAIGSACAVYFDRLPFLEGTLHAGPSPGARSLYTRLGFVDDATGVMSLSA